MGKMNINKCKKHTCKYESIELQELQPYVKNINIKQSLKLIEYIKLYINEHTYRNQYI